VEEDFFHPDLCFSSGQRMQLDVFVPEYSLAFEYQGRQHYWDVFVLGSQWHYEQRDREKREACHEKGITLVEVPYWWDDSKESLLATIQQLRPGCMIACKCLMEQM
jgi:hypothetical protein